MALLGVIVEELDKKLHTLTSRFRRKHKKANGFREKCNVSNKVCVVRLRATHVSVSTNSVKRLHKHGQWAKGWCKWNKFILSPFSIYLCTRLLAPVGVDAEQWIGTVPRQSCGTVPIQLRNNVPQQWVPVCASLKGI